MSQGPQQLKPKGIKKADIGIIAIITLLIVGVIIFMRNASGKPDKLNYNDFRQYVIEAGSKTPLSPRSEAIISVTLISRAITAILRIKRPVTLL